MSLTLNVPQEYGYVLAVATISTVVSYWHGSNTAKYRKRAKVPYPNAYCTDAEAKADKAKYLFNCAQRSHANFLEAQPQFLVGLLVGGLRYPVVSAGLGVAWSVSRIVYTLGYCREDYENGRGRSLGAGSSTLILFALIGLGGATGYQMIMS